MGTLAKYNSKAGAGAIDARIHQRGYELWRAGIQAPEIRTILKITHRQWQWLLEVGDADAEMPSYRRMMVEEVAAIRNASSEAAVDLATKGVAVLRDRITNAGLANRLIEGILVHSMHRVVQCEKEAAIQSDKPRDPQVDLAMAMPRPATIEMLKVLARFADMGSAAHAFRVIYGDHALQRALYPLSDATKRDDGDALRQIDGKQSKQHEFIPPDALNDLLVDVMAWSPGDVDTFAEGGEEPPPNR